MKDANKMAIKKSKKNIKQKLEIDISEKLKTFISSLGHDVEDIGDELKKASKLIAKKLSKKIKDVKIALNDKLNSETTKTEKVVGKAKKELVKDATQTKKTANSTLIKIKKDTTQKIEPLKKEVGTVTNVVKKVATNVKKEIAKPKTVTKAPVLNTNPTLLKTTKTVTEPNLNLK